MSRSPFPDMHRVVPEGKAGGYEVEHFTVDKHAAQMTAFGGARDYVPTGRYARLLHGEKGSYRCETLMSDTPYEHRTNWRAQHEARGRVLVAGYGLGMLLCAILKKPQVQQVVVVEISDAVLQLVDQHVRRHVGARAAKKLSTVTGSIHDVRDRVSDGGKFDTIWFDIWGSCSTDTLQEMSKLKRHYRRLLADGGWMECWDIEWLRYRRGQERRAGW